MLNISQATSLVSQGNAIQIKDQHLVKCTFKERIHLLTSKKYQAQHTQKIIAFLAEKLTQGPTEQKKAYLTLANAFIKTHQKSSATRVFDREIAPQRQEIEFFHGKNQLGLKKWIRNGQSPEIYQKYPEFCQFLDESKVLSQLKATRDKIVEIDGEPALCVAGEPMPWSQLKAQFRFEYSYKFNDVFLIKKDSDQVYTYLDNGKGLQPHHPYLSQKTPFSYVDEADYQKTLTKAQTFVRPGEEALSAAERAVLNEDRTFIFQLVTSQNAGPNTNFHNLLVKPKHPYIRLIIGKDNPEMGVKKGEVYEIGYGWKRAVPLPLITTSGQFRSPDVSGYKPSKSRIVTNIPITQAEAKAFVDYTALYHRLGVEMGDSLAFHMTRQNCSSYVKVALEVIGVKVPVVLSLGQIIKEIAPDAVKKTAHVCQLGLKKITQFSNKMVSVLPTRLVEGIKKVLKFAYKCIKAPFEIGMAFIANCVRVLLGASKGKEGLVFVNPNEPSRRMQPDGTNLNTWYKLSCHCISLPGAIQKWQRTQASTVIYDNPVKAAIVP